jgi:hypothetical protein
MAIVLLGLGVAAAGGGMALRVSALVGGAVLPLAIGAALVVLARPGFRARFTSSALEIARPARTVPYASIVQVRPAGRVAAAAGDDFPIEVAHARGHFVIPAPLTVPSERVYAFLRGHVPDSPPPLPRELEDYRHAQEKAFGPDRVWSYGARRGGGLTSPGARATAIGCLVAAAAWTALGLRRPEERGWLVAAGFGVVLGLLIGTFDWAHRRRFALATPRSAATGLVISPVGLAMKSDALSGHLTWQQVRNVAVRAQGRWTAGSAGLPGIAIEVEGASILIPDAYDRPLSEIHDRISRYWR